MTRVTTLAMYFGGSNNDGLKSHNSFFLQAAVRRDASTA